MCQPHGFVVTDCDCPQPITPFVGFHICPLLEIKHGLCAGCFLYIVCLFPEESPQPEVSEFPQVGLVRNFALSYTFFFVFPSLFYSNSHSFVMTIMTLFIPIFHSLTACLSVRYSAQQTSFSLSFIPSHVIDHLTAMRLPHGFVVTDHNCIKPIAAFVGFCVCPLLETKHGLCVVHF
jgi:hypothetical protein